MPNELITIAQELWTGDLHLAFQNTGYKLAAWCNRGGAVQGSRLYWPKLAALAGSGEAGPAVGGVLTFTGGTHTQVYVDMVDRYATPLALKEEDMQKVVTNVDYRQGYAMNQNAQLGRYADDQIIAAFNTGKNGTVLGPGNGTALNIGHFHALREAFDEAEIPDDGMRVVFVHPKVWSQLLYFKEFANADWIGAGELPYAGNGMTGKRWQSFQWVTFTRVPVDGVTAVASCMAWHPHCMGHGVNGAPSTTISQENTMGGQFAVVSKQSMGAAVIDNTGVFEFAVDTNTAPAPT